jgi:hypothetical protein
VVSTSEKPPKYSLQILPTGSLSLAFEDTQLSDAIGPQKILDHYCNQTVDAVMGMAYVFALAPVARMSQFWGVGGVPVFTTTVRIKSLSKEYPHIMAIKPLDFQNIPKKYFPLLFLSPISGHGG